MPKITNKKQVEHGAADSETHKEDKARNEAKRSFTMLYIPVRTQDVFGFRREFSRYLGNGEQFSVEPNKDNPQGGDPWKLVSKKTPDWINEHEKMRKDRGWFWEERERQRKAGKIKTKEPRKFDPFNDLFVTLGPWTQAYLFLLLKYTMSSGKRRVQRYLRKCLVNVITLVAARTGNEIPFAYIHHDTDDLHIGVRPCCIDAQNYRIGDPFMRTVGHAAVGYDRQERVGAASQEALKRLLRSKTIYTKRAQEAGLPPKLARIPLDLELAREVDRIAEVHFGKDPLFIKAKECYYLYASQKDILHYSKKTLKKKIEELTQRLATITALEEKHAKALEDLAKLREGDLETEEPDGDEPQTKKPAGSGEIPI